MIQEFIIKPATAYLRTDSNTDKMHSHRYDEFYDMIFALLLCRIQRPLKVLEVGVSNMGVEASYHAFAKMTYINRYVGVDREPLDTDLPTGMAFIHSDAYVPEVLDHINPFAPFDLLIDDGSHNVEDQHFFWKHYQQFMHERHAAIVVEDVPDVEIDQRVELFNDTKIQIYRGNPSMEAIRRRDHSNIIFKVRENGGYS